MPITSLNGDTTILDESTKRVVSSFQMCAGMLRLSCQRIAAARMRELMKTGRFNSVVEILAEATGFEPV
jgi:hypothetical protein